MSGNAGETFAANAKALADLAAKVLSARNAGDFYAADDYKRQYDALLGRLAPDQRKLADQAYTDELPSEWELWLLGLQKWVKRAPTLALVVALGVVAVVVYRKVK